MVVGERPGTGDSISLGLGRAAVYQYKTGSQGEHPHGCAYPSSFFFNLSHS